MIAPKSSGTYASEFLAEEIDGKRNVYPVIKNSAGEVVWQEDADVLWLLSGDIGFSRVVEKDKDWDWGMLPPDIEKIKEGW